MQFFRFIFLARSWAKDKGPLGEHIVDVAEQAKAADSKLALMFFPEGTLVSPDTRPLSKKYADKVGIVCLPEPINNDLARTDRILYQVRPSTRTLAAFNRSLVHSSLDGSNNTGLATA